MLDFRGVHVDETMANILVPGAPNTFWTLKNPAQDTLSEGSKGALGGFNSDNPVLHGISNSGL